MRKDFYVFRHGETDYNLSGRWQGCGIDADLNKTGIDQAKHLAEKLKDFNIEIIYSSPLKRALKTAQIVAKKIKKDIKTEQQLREASVGLCEGLKKEDIKNKYPEIWAEWYNDVTNWDIRWPEGESKKEIRERMFDVFNKLVKTDEKIIAIASHSGSIRYFLMGLGCEPHKMPNTALFHIIYEDGNWIFDKML